MEAMFETVAAELGGGSPIGSWRRTYRTTESRIVAVLEAGGERYPAVKVGSYPASEPKASSGFECFVPYPSTNSSYSFLKDDKNLAVRTNSLA